MFRILASFQESFILRLFRENKRNGFVKAFTDDPVRIVVSGMGQLQRLMDKLYVKKLSILPRFDAEVKKMLGDDPVNFHFRLELTN